MKVTAIACLAAAFGLGSSSCESATTHPAAKFATGVSAPATVSGATAPSVGSPVKSVPTAMPTRATPAVTRDAPKPKPPLNPTQGGLARFADSGQVTYSMNLTAGGCHVGAGNIPDSRCTPGSTNPTVTQANINSTICTSGYTATIRPPESQTERAKYDTAYPAYSIPGGDHSELDHLVPLELGGSNDITNLWPEVGSIPNSKDAVENAANAAVCDGRITLATAQDAIARDWVTFGRQLGVSP